MKINKGMILFLVLILSFNFVFACEDFKSEFEQIMKGTLDQVDFNDLKSLDENKIIEFQVIQEMLGQSSSNLNVESNLEILTAKYPECKNELTSEFLYEMMLKLYIEICTRLDRGIYLENVELSENAYNGHCKIKADKTKTITPQLEKELINFDQTINNLASSLEIEATEESQEVVQEKVELVNDIKVETENEVSKREESTTSKKENFIDKYFGFLIEKLPFDNYKYNYYLFIAIVVLGSYFMLFKR